MEQLSILGNFLCFLTLAAVLEMFDSVHIFIQ